MSIGGIPPMGQFSADHISSTRWDESTQADFKYMNQVQSLKLLAFSAVQTLQIMYTFVAVLCDSEGDASSMNGISFSSDQGVHGVIYSIWCVLICVSMPAVFVYSIYAYYSQVGSDAAAKKDWIQYSNRIIVVLLSVATFLRWSSTDTAFNFPKQNSQVLARMNDLYFLGLVSSKFEDCELSGARVLLAKLIFHLATILCFFKDSSAVSFAALGLCGFSFMVSDFVTWKMNGFNKLKRIKRYFSIIEQTIPTPLVVQKKKNAESERNITNQVLQQRDSQESQQETQEWQKHFNEVQIGVVTFKQSTNEVTLMNSFARKLLESKFGKRSRTEMTEFLLKEIEFSVIPLNPKADRNKIDRKRIAEFSSSVKQIAKNKNEPRSSKNIEPRMSVPQVIKAAATTSTKPGTAAATRKLEQILDDFDGFCAENSYYCNNDQSSNDQEGVTAVGKQQSSDSVPSPLMKGIMEIYAKIPSWNGQETISVIGKISVRKSSQEFILILDEITKYESLANLADRDEYKNRILNSMSHELHTPLNFSMGCLAVALEEQDISDSIKKNVLQPIMKSQRKGLSIINNILDFQLIITNNILKINFEQFSVSSILTALQELFAEEFESQGISLSFEVNVPQDEYICTDYDRLISILMNLINNAMRYTRKGGVTIRISYYSGTRHLVFEVTDTGRGMDLNHYKQITEKLSNFNITDCLVTDNQHMGLGLTISQIIVSILAVEQQNLQLTQNASGGCTFTFTIENINYTSETSPSNTSHRSQFFKSNRRVDFVLRRVQTQGFKEMNSSNKLNNSSENRLKAKQYQKRQSYTVPIRESINSDVQESGDSHSILPLNHMPSLENGMHSQLKLRNHMINVSLDSQNVSSGFSGCSLNSVVQCGAHLLITPLCGDEEEVMAISSDGADSVQVEELQLQLPTLKLGMKQPITEHTITAPSPKQPQTQTQPQQNQRQDHPSISADYQMQKLQYIKQISLRSSNLFNNLGGHQTQNTRSVLDPSTPLPSTQREMSSNQFMNYCDHHSIVSNTQENNNIEKRVQDHDFNLIMKHRKGVNLLQQQQQQLPENVQYTFRNSPQSHNSFVLEDLAKVESNHEYLSKPAKANQSKMENSVSPSLMPRQLQQVSGMLLNEGKMRATTRDNFIRLSSLTSQQKDDHKIAGVSELGQNYVSCACKRILCVDDEIMNIQILKVYLKKIGFEEEIAFNGQEAIELFLTMVHDRSKQCSAAAAGQCTIFNAILLDCNMPTMDGWDCSRILRGLMAKGSLPSIPIIAVTSYVTQQVTELCIESGMDIVLNKPVHIDTIRKTLFSMIPIYIPDPKLQREESDKLVIEKTSNIRRLS